MSQYVVFVTPSFDGKPDLGFTTSLLRTTQLLDAKGIRWDFLTVAGDPYLAKARNALVSSALRDLPAMTDLFFLDADLEWPPEAVLKLLAHEADVVAGIYPKKNDNTAYPCELEQDAESGGIIERDGWIKARRVPTGFLRLKRSVLEKCAADSSRYRDQTHGNIECWNIFEMGYSGHNLDADGRGEWWGEDYAWCEKWHSLGGAIWVWPDIAFGHRGFKTWRGNYNDCFKTADEVIAPHLQAAE